MLPNSHHEPWWLNPSEFNLSRNQSGLSAAEAKIRLDKYGLNTFHEQHDKSLLSQFLKRFQNPLVIILLIASIVSAFTGEITNFLIISCIVLLSVTMDFIQEYRANQAVKKLQLSVAVCALVVRDGTELQIPVSQIVPGDIVLLSAGNLIPADGKIIESKNLFVKQALLTGESFPVEKNSAAPPPTANELQDATNAVFMGTSVISGQARVQIVKTGAETAIGEIANTLARPAKPTSFETGSRQFGMLIMRLTVLMVMFVLLTNTLMGKPWLESFLFAVALAVGLTPELLPMIVSVTLASGALRMAKKHMIVKRVGAIQDLGSMDVLCTDKTGTLTEAKIRMEKHIDPQGQSSEWVLKLAYLNSFYESGLKNPVDEAILSHQDIDVSAWQKIDEVPFDFERRCISVLLDNDKTRWLVVKGAPDEILRLCTHFEINGSEHLHPIDAVSLPALYEQYHALERDGFRVLGIAWRQVPLTHPRAVVSDETELVLAGFAAFFDPPKVSAASSLKELKNVGVEIKIVTGDSDLVTRHVCSELKIPVTGLLTGTEIEQMDDHALQAKAEVTNLFCRVNPAQKNRVILALKARGHVVGYLGDGINDAPSIHSSDVGLSVDSAVDVAKEAADMILLKHDLHVLHTGVLEGRRTFSNIMKYIMMGTSSNFGNMFSMAGAALFLPFLPMLPTQILLNNILYDISEIPIPLDEVDTEELITPRIMDLVFIRNFMLMIGPISSLFDFLTFYLMLVVLHADEKIFQTGWFVESLSTQVLVIFIIRTRASPLKSFAHPLLLITSLLIVFTAIILPFTPVGAYFGFVALSWQFYLILGALVITYLLMVEIAR